MVEALHGAADLPELLQRSNYFEDVTHLDPVTSDTVYFQFAEMVVRLVKNLEELCTEHPELFRPLARELPYWPMLVFRHKAANNHLFRKSADGEKPLADALDLGSDCPINVSNRANYSLKTPVNSFLWSILADLHWGRDWVRSIREKRSGRERPAQSEIALMSERTGISREEAKIHFVASDLPPLDKSTSDQWVDQVIMPWIRLRHTDLRSVAAFRSTDVGPHGRRYAPARKVILRALCNLARPSGTGWR
jgi:hypothetical protein